MDRNFNALFLPMRIILRIKSIKKLRLGQRVEIGLEVMHWIEQFYLKPNLYATERQNITEDFLAIRDNKSCECILEKIGHLI
jgi:hypothetical protein